MEFIPLERPRLLCQTLFPHFVPSHTTPVFPSGMSSASGFVGPPSPCFLHGHWISQSIPPPTPNSCGQLQEQEPPSAPSFRSQQALPPLFFPVLALPNLCHPYKAEFQFVQEAEQRQCLPWRASRCCFTSPSDPALKVLLNSSGFWMFSSSPGMSVELCTPTFPLRIPELLFVGCFEAWLGDLSGNPTDLCLQNQDGSGVPACPFCQSSSQRCQTCSRQR